jgi:hypothetical protein
MQRTPWKARVWLSWLLGAWVWLVASAAFAEEPSAPYDLTPAQEEAEACSRAEDCCEAPASWLAMLLFDVSRCSEDPAPPGAACEVYAHLQTANPREHCAPPLLKASRNRDPHQAPPSAFSCGPQTGKGIPPPAPLVWLDDPLAPLHAGLVLKTPFSIKEEQAPLGFSSFPRPGVFRVPTPPPRVA